VTASRGEVWFADLGHPVGREQSVRRPVVVVSSDLMNDGPTGVVVVVPVTTADRGLPSHIELDPSESGLPQISFAKAEDVRTISEERLGEVVGRLGPAPMHEISQALRLLLEL
jgi:mRNA interferase MazF